MFMFQANVLIDELSEHSPNIVASSIVAVSNATKDFDFIRLDKKSFESSPSDSIDYALMEKSRNVVVVPLNAGWNDIGSWSALYDIGEKDANGNVVNGDIFMQDTTNTYIHANGHIVAAIGVQDLIIIDTPDATLISTKDKSQEVKNIIKQFQSKNRKEQLFHRKVYRPWGWYDSIETGKNFQVKRLHVKPNAKLSLQMHHKRAEHWVIVSGEATVTLGKKIFILKEGGSTYIPVKTMHRLENNTKKNLEVIEVQSGNYLGEDDIVRMEDLYQRA